MRLKLKHLFLFLPAILSHLYLKAQDSTLTGMPLKWDLQQCIDYAKKNNIQINSLHLSQKISEQEYLQAKAARLPDLSGSVSQTFFNNESGVTQNGSKGSSGLSPSGEYSLSSSVTLYNGGNINNTIKQKNIAVQSAGLSISQQENNITLQLAQAYLTVLIDKETIVSDSDIVTTSQAQVKLEKQMYDVGSVARKDLIQLQAQTATDQYNLVAAKNTERGDLLTLKQLLILPVEAKFDIAKPEITITPGGLAPLHDAELLALSTFPEVKNGQLSVEIAQYTVKTAAAGFKPTLSAGASVGSGYSNWGSYFSQISNNFYQQAGLTLSVPLFTKRVVKTQVEEAKINVGQAQLTLSNAVITLSQAVERAYINAENARGQYDAANVQYKFNEESYRIANEQLKIGASNVVDFLLVKTQFVQAQQAVIQAKYNLLLTLKIYDFYRGLPIKL